MFQIDNKKCIRCKSKGIHIHHIQKVSNTDYSNENSIKLIYQINNLVALCKDCHDDTHNGYSYYINEVIQKELQELANNRLIPQDLLDEYNEIVATKIEPWLNEYHDKKGPPNRTC